MMITLTEWMPVAGIAVDVLLIVLVGMLLHRLSKDPTAVWKAREARLGEIYEALRLLVAQAEGQARALDADLSARAERLMGLLERSTEREASASVAAPTRSAPEPRRDSVRSQVAQLARSGLDPVEIAHEVNLPLAEVRLLVGLESADRDRAAAAAAGGQE